MAARRGRRDRVAPPPTGGPGPDPGGGVRGGSWASRSQAPYGTGGSVSAAEQVHEEGNDSSFVSLSRLGPSLREKDLEMEELILQDETLLETMQSYMDASLISLIEDFGESRLSLEDQNEMSLLTALTEILDNADSENLSPFDTIPDSELLVSPRESSSLHKLLNLSRTPPERDLITPIDPLGPSTGSSRVEVPLADSPWDFSPPPFLETSSPKLPSWRPSRPRPRWGQSPPPQQRSDGEEEEEVAGFSGQMLAGKLDNSVNNVLDFPMHLACPEEEGTAEGADAPASAPGDESISSLSELVRAMHPYCLPNLTHLASLEGELEGQADADADELTLPEGCVVLEIVGQAATTGDDLEIPVVVRQIPSGSQSVLLDESLGSSPALQLLMPTMESETEAAVPEVAPCPDEELPLSSACLLEPREIMESLTPKEPQSLPASASQGSQKVPRKGRKKKNKEQPTACVEACTRRLRSSSRGQSTVSAEVNSQAGSSQKQPQEELQREAAALQSRGKPRAWARAWAAALEKTGSENLERSAGQDSPAEEDALDLCPKLLETSQANPTLSLNDSAQADSMPVDSVEGDSPAVGNAAPGDQASSGTELVGSLPVGPNLTSPVLADKKGIEPAVAIPTSDNLSPGLPVSMRQMPPDPYTQYAPVPPWSCYPSVSPPGYSCLPPPPTMPIVSGTPGTYAVPPTCNVPWVPPPAPVSPYSSSCAYGSLGWGPGLQQPPFWSTVSPPPLSSVPTGRAVPPTPVEPSGDPAGPPEDVLPGPVTPSLSSGPASPAAPPVEPTKPEAQPVPVSPQPKHKVSTLVQSPQIKAPPTLSTEGVVFEESVSERLKSETQENRPKEKPISTAIKSVPVPKQSAVAKLPAVHPARLRKLSFLPTPRAQGPEDVVQAFISEIGIEASDLSSLLEQFEKSEDAFGARHCGTFLIPALGRQRRADF